MKKEKDSHRKGGVPTPVSGAHIKGEGEKELLLRCYKVTELSKKKNITTEEQRPAAFRIRGGNWLTSEKAPEPPLGGENRSERS